MEADTASTYVIEIIMSKLMIGLMGEGDSEHPLVSPVSSHTTRAKMTSLWLHLSVLTAK